MSKRSPRELRESRGRSQVGVAAAMRISQPAVSKLERRADVSIAALGAYVAALGGELEVRARFPDGVVPLAVGKALRGKRRAATSKKSERPAFAMPEEWAAEVVRIRSLSPEARMEEIANFTQFFAEAKRRG